MGRICDFRDNGLENQHRHFCFGDLKTIVPLFFAGGALFEVALWFVGEFKYRRSSGENT